MRAAADNKRHAPGGQGWLTIWQLNDGSDSLHIPRILAADCAEKERERRSDWCDNLNLKL